ncbi:unnamed protein product [Polarella glacialis]|uniref:Uncharacterized protein n=1 Tax=Polarella glacialis TaxID=89957 RepID=A0A813E5R9_POLGL|nr:unnamed protein product [Polarella glacialis]
MSKIGTGVVQLRPGSCQQQNRAPWPCDIPSSRRISSLSSQVSVGLAGVHKMSSLYYLRKNRQQQQQQQQQQRCLTQSLQIVGHGKTAENRHSQFMPDQRGRATPPTHTHNCMHPLTCVSLLALSRASCGAG